MLRRAASRLAAAARGGQGARRYAKDGGAAGKQQPAAGGNANANAGNAGEGPLAPGSAGNDQGNPLSAYMFPWERSVLDHGGEAGKIDSWTKAYWAVFATAMIGYVAYDLSTATARPKKAEKTAEEEEWERKEITRIEEERVRQALAGEAKLGAADEDVFEGMEPAHIELWMAHERTKRGKASLHDVDPYEGLSPEEIQALVDGK